MDTSTVLAADLAPEAERARRLPDELVRALAADGHLRMAVPARLGGGERTLPDLLRRLRSLAGADASTAWCVMVWTQAQIVAALLDEWRYTRLFAPDPDVVIAATAAGHGVARKDGRGLRVSGRWRFTSGVSHAARVLVHCELAGDPPRPVGLLLDRSRLTVDDTWTVLGLRATASNGIHADGVSAAKDDVYELDGTPCASATPHSALPVRPSFALHMAAIALGCATAALADAGDTGGTADARDTAVAADITVAEEPEESDARAAVDASWAEVDACAHRVWGRAGRVDDDTQDQMLELSRRAVRTSLDAALAAYRAAGSAAVFDAHPLQRRLRDLLTISQHANVSGRRGRTAPEVRATRQGRVP